MKMFLISDSLDTYTGMRLAGVDGVVVHEKDEFKQELDRVLKREDVAIVLLTESLSKEYPEIVGKVKLENKLPLIIEIPDRHGTGRSKDFITSYVNQAIGLRLN